VILDEATLIPEGILNTLVEQSERYGFKLIFCYDPAQMTSMYVDRKKRVERLEKIGEIVNFEYDMRSLDDKLRRLKRDLWKLSMISMREPEKLELVIKNILSVSCGFVQYKKREHEGLPIIAFNKMSGDITPDKLQGCTIPSGRKYVIKINPESMRKSVYPELVYTAVSRFRNYDDIVIWKNLYMGNLRDE